MRIRSQRLPAGYQEVEYIESTGTQRIKLNITPTSQYKIEEVFAITDKTVTSCIWCARGATTQTTSLTAFNIANNNLRVDFNSSQTYIQSLTANQKYNLTLDSNKWYLDGVLKLTSSASAVFTAGGKLELFASYTNGQDNSLANYAKLKMYSFRVWNANRELVGYFVPCYRKSDNVIGMYDTVEKGFYTNDGTGTFLKGDNIKDSFKISTAIIEGTTNLGKTSMNYSNKTNGSTVSCNGWGGDAGTCTFYYSGGYNNYPYKVYHKTATGTGGIYYKTANDITIEAGKTYTMSVYIKASVNVNNASAYSFNINRGSDNYYINYGASFNIATNWKRLVKTFTATSSQAGLYGEMSIIYDDNVTDYYVYYSGFQIEEKDHATPYVNGTREDSTIVNFKPHTTLLPPEYQQTEYTANTNGAQYIEYPFVPSYNRGWKFEIGFNPTDTTTRYALTANYNVGNYQVSLELRANSKARLWCYNGSKDFDSSNSYVANQLNNATFSYYSGVCTIVLNGVTTTSAANYNTVCSSPTMYLFLDKAKRTSTFPKPIKIYYLRIYDGTNLAFNLIPCYRKSDNVIGMYDIVNKVFYSNSGTGSFNKGSNYVKIL